MLSIMNLLPSFRHSLFEKEQIACTKTVYNIVVATMLASPIATAILASPKHEAFAWIYRSSIYTRVDDVKI